jgi:hypothetical protein
MEEMKWFSSAMLDVLAANVLGFGLDWLSIAHHGIITYLITIKPPLGSSSSPALPLYSFCVCWVKQRMLVDVLLPPCHKEDLLITLV